MAEDKKQPAKEPSQQKGEDAIRGRMHNSQAPGIDQQDAQHDISAIDRQEGDLEHGEKGGNLNEQSQVDKS